MYSISKKSVLVGLVVLNVLFPVAGLAQDMSDNVGVTDYQGTPIEAPLTTTQAPDYPTDYAVPNLVLDSHGNLEPAIVGGSVIMTPPAIRP